MAMKGMKDGVKVICGVARACVGTDDEGALSQR